MDQLSPSARALMPYLAAIRARLRLRDGLLLAQRTLWLALLAVGLVLVAGRIWPLEYSRVWALAPLVIWMVGVTGYTLLHPLPAERVARRAEAELHLKERLSTSFVMENNPAFNSFEPHLVQQAHADALRSARAIIPAVDFPLHMAHGALLLSAGLLTAAALLAWLPNPMDAVIVERQAVAAEAKRQAKEIEKLQQKITEAKDLSPAERDALQKKLAELAKQLRNAATREQALADLSRLEEALRQQQDPQAAQRQAALDAMSAQMQALAKAPNPQIGDLQAAAAALQKLAEQMKNMSAEERKALAQQLAQMAARAAQTGDGELSQSLAAMAQAAQSGDAQSAAQAAKQAAGALTQAQAQLANQRALNQTLSQLQNSRQAIVQAGQLGQSAQQGPGQNPGQGQGQGQSPGQAQQPGQGQGQGQAQAQGQGQQAGGGGGTNANSLPPANRTGKAGKPQGAGTDSGVSGLDSKIYVPREQTGTNGEKLNITGQDTGQGQTEVKNQSSPQDGANNTVLTPYNLVYQTYLDAANQAMEQGSIPAGMKDYIREYFSQLQPQ